MLCFTLHCITGKMFVQIGPITNTSTNYKLDGAFHEKPPKIGPKQLLR